MHRKIALNDFLNNHVLTNLKVDKTQTFGLYFDNVQDEADNLYRREVQLIEIEGFKTSRLDLDFEPDDFIFADRKIIFKVSSDSSTVFYLYDPGSLSCSELTEIPFSVGEFAFTDSKIFFTAEVQGLDSSALVKCGQKGPFYREGRGAAGNGITVLFQSSVAGRDISMISSLDMDIDRIDFDLADNRIVFTAFSVQNLKPVNSELYLYNTGTESIKHIKTGVYRIDYVQSMNEETILFMGIDLEKGNRNGNQQIYRVDTGTEQFAPFGRFLDKSNENPGVATDSFFTSSYPAQRYKDDFYFNQMESDRESLYRIDPEGNVEEIDTGMKIIGGFQVLDSGILFIGIAGFSLSEVYFYSSGGLKQLTGYNNWTDDLILSKPEKMTVNAGGADIDGFVYPPVSAEPGAGCPAVLMIHGGPKMIYSDVFAQDIQLLCANGFYVFCANPMGSDGKGDAFADIRGRFGHLPYEQLMEFTDKVLEKYPLIDAERLGVSGGSYGGYMTNYIITRTSRFRAAVSERGISNLLTSFTATDIGYQFVPEYMGGNSSPWAVQAEIIDASPIYRADKVTTPTLFIHGKSDYRCHYTESLNMFGALNYHGVETRICLFENEGHGLVVRGKPESKKHRYKEFLGWFEKFLKPEDTGRA